jgi:putative ATP-dependent endonuclease of OLD family
MQLLRLTVSGFRGIKQLDWHVGGESVCLLGPGDSAKSTILTAIEYCLYPNPTLQIFDTDFTNQDTESPIEIEAVIGGLPEALFSDDQYGLALRGYDMAKAELRDEPGESLETAVVVNLRIEADLEPQWVLKRHGEGDVIPLRRRSRLFKVARLTERINTDLGWARNSALSRITSSATESRAHLADVFRAASGEFRGANVESLKTTTEKIGPELLKFGVTASNLQPGLLQYSFMARGGAIGLFDGNVPMSQKGLGTRRLAALAVQQSLVEERSIVLIDEIETGLEPFRIEGLLRSLGCFNCGSQANQLLFTTHSPTPILKLEASHLGFVRSDEGHISVAKFERPVDDTVAATIRKHATALLARSVVIGEGKTEFGLIRGYFSSEIAKEENLMALGADVVDGGGRTNAPKSAIALQNMGYAVFVLADSDEPLKPTEEDLRKAGIAVHVWDGGMATEGRLCADLPNQGLVELLELASSRKSEKLIHEQLLSALDGAPQPAWLDLLDCLARETEFTDSERAIIGQAANSGEWFKTIEGGEALAGLVAKHEKQMQGTPLLKGLEAVAGWLDDNAV